jgi:Uma2 family endonuclease
MTLTADNPAVPHLKRWTRQEYQSLLEKGFVRHQQTFLYRGELVDRTAEGELVPKLWTKSEFIQKAEQGFLSKQRVILFRGDLIEMPSMGALHINGVKKLGYWLHAEFRPEFEVRMQLPFEAFDQTLPEPDGGIFTRDQDGRTPLPNSALLLVEVSESSLELDREMAFDYAASQVQEYWIVNVRDRQVEIYRNSIADSKSVTGFSYSSHRIALEPEVISSLAKPAAALAVSELLKIG